MRLFRGSLADALSGREPVVGFWGAPPLEALEDACRRHGDARLFDLDVHHGAPRLGAIPDAFCHIIRNCVDNAVALGDRLGSIVAATGPEKCDAGRFAAGLVEELTGVEVVRTTNDARDDGHAAATPLCDARGPLKRRVVRIMEAIVEPLDDRELEAAAAARCKPTHGFWGTPPHPIGLLDLFPDTTRVFGWTRCVEAGRPADLALELEVPRGLPIVFFSQGFCAKGMLARRLAERHRGMHVDVHDSMGAATMAKIEAFIRLSGGAR